MHRSWVINSSWPLRRCKMEIHASLMGLPIRRYESWFCENQWMSIKDLIDIGTSKFQRVLCVVGC